jgi:DNA-binding response OmpR family regulator
VSTQRQKILNVARDESLLKSRSAILEGAGYEVIPALTILNVQAACETHQSLDLVIIGYALPKEEKRRVMVAIRKFCGPTRIPILELYSPGTVPTDGEADEELATSGEAEILLAKVRDILTTKRKKRRAAS